MPSESRHLNLTVLTPPVCLAPIPQFHFTRTQIVQQWNRVVEHDVLPAPLNLVHLTTCLLLKPCVSKQRYPLLMMRIGCFLFWLVMGPLGAALAIAMWFVSIPWSIWHLVFGGQVCVCVCVRLERYAVGHTSNPYGCEQ